ncbi:MAG: capsular biosynthesis protein [Alphaproteobacteria bacterium]|nr:capsular biosynthesis protein [Alphaproteobacteria bacterium]
MEFGRPSEGHRNQTGYDDDPRGLALGLTETRLDRHGTDRVARAIFAEQRRRPADRIFLFLQSMATRFFARLAAALAARGYEVHRVNFNGGDRAFWNLPNAVDFCGREAEWPEFLDHLLVHRAVTDIILFGDCRPLHRAAIHVAAGRRVRVHVVEEGYVRPDWITFEEGGTNGYSSLPRDPDWYRRQARDLPDWRPPPRVPGSFRRRAFEVVLYDLASAAAIRRFPHFRTHRPYHPLVECAGWLRRLVLIRKNERRAAAAIETLTGHPIYFFPLQLDCDYQMRVHSPFGTTHIALEYVLRSFARNAPATARLVVKLHPLDSGIVDWVGVIGHLGCELAVTDRVTVLDGGDLSRVLARADAVVTVNSTVGTEALANGLPVMALGKAMYGLPGLTCQGQLDQFWSDASAPDMALFDAFRRVLAAQCMIPGSFFNEEGLRLAVAAAVHRLEMADPRPARHPPEGIAAVTAP